ncbi:MAG: restriction endonuclease subunit S [Ignavibacteriae bacterium]|nr:MAG: restriction endonuclease subunit S [Ignavibacteriota bacterium]
MNLLLQVYNIADYGILDFKDTFNISDDDFIKWTKNIILQEGDCIITNAGRIGAVAQIPFFGKYAIGRNITAIRPMEEIIKPAYLINYLLSQYMEQEIYKNTDIGTILDSLNVKGIRVVKILMPNSDILEKYEEFARPLRELIEINTSKID